MPPHCGGRQRRNAESRETEDEELVAGQRPSWAKGRRPEGRVSSIIARDARGSGGTCRKE